MKQTILHPPYRRLVQQPMLCAAASVQMVLFRHGYWFDQEVIAAALGAVVRKSQAKFYDHPFPTAADDDLKRLGIRLVGIDTKLNQLFRTNELPLTAKMYCLSELPDLGRFLIQALAARHDVIGNFWHVAQAPRTSMGHFAPVAAVTASKVTFCDPYPQHPATWSMNLATLRERMDDRWDGKDRGVVLIRPSTKVR